MESIYKDLCLSVPQSTWLLHLLLLANWVSRVLIIGNQLYAWDSIIFFLLQKYITGQKSALLKYFVAI